MANKFEIFRPEQEGQRNKNTADLVLRMQVGADASQGQKSVLEGFVNGSEYAVRVPQTAVGPGRLISLIDTALKYYRDSYVDGVPSVGGKVIPTQSTEEAPWSLSVWTNYGEQQFPYQGPFDWSRTVQSISQERGIDSQHAEKAVSYLRVETPFAAFGYDLKKGDLALATNVKDAKGFIPLFTQIVDGEETIIGEFLGQIPQEKESSIR